MVEAVQAAATVLATVRGNLVVSAAALRANQCLRLVASAAATATATATTSSAAPADRRTDAGETVVAIPARASGRAFSFTATDLSDAGQTQAISDAIVDQTGVGGTGADAGSWSLVKNGGTVQGNTTSLRGDIVFDSNAGNQSRRQSHSIS